MKRCLLAWLAVFVAWSVLDFLGHGLAFQSLYAQGAGVWRPQAEMKIGVIYLAVAITSGAFVGVYSRLISSKCVGNGVIYGALFGIGAGASMAGGGYAVHPIPMELAGGWFVLTLIESIAGGWLVGKIAPECCPPLEPQKS